MSDFEDATTTELLALPVCKKIVATFAGMEDLSAFEAVPHKLENLVEALVNATQVPASLSVYSLSEIHHAGEMVRHCVMKDTSAYDEIMNDILGLNLDDDDEDELDGFDDPCGD